MKIRPFYTLLLLLLILSHFSCHNSGRPPMPAKNKISGDVVIFHAGSLSVPFQKIARAFEAEYPGTRVLLEASGSVDCARKITDMHKPCDLMASSDYKIIKKMLMPHYTSWYLPFAGNEMVIAYTDKSTGGAEISQDNWIESLLREDVRYSRSDPNADPCGYRTLMVWQLAESYYDQQGITKKLASKDIKYVRPKEVDLLALLEIHETDYIFIYKSVAIQHGLKYLELPVQINLKSVDYDEQYSQASVSIKGNTPDATLNVKGESISYAITLLDNSPNPTAAIAFLKYMLNKEKGMKILIQAGHNSLIPYVNPQEFIYPVFLDDYTDRRTID